MILPRQMFIKSFFFINGQKWAWPLIYAKFRSSSTVYALNILANQNGLDDRELSVISDTQAQSYGCFL